MTGYRLMADSTTPWLIPATFNAPDCLVAPYMDGRYAWDSRQLARFPLAVKVPITVLGAVTAPVCDVETGDVDPLGFVAWLKARHDAGEKYHALYSSRDTKPQVDAAVEAAGLSVRLYGWWAADPTGVPHRVPGSLATQYFWGSGAHNYDITAVYEAGWHPATATAA
jgi:hypothetical protein